MHEIYLLLGSNINPRKNLSRALSMLREAVKVQKLSSYWQSGAFESSGPDFLNVAACIETDLSAEQLKWQVLRGIETELGRVRTGNENAPRTIDLDIVIFDGEVLDEKLWYRYYVAVPIAELLPGFEDPQQKRPLREIAENLKNSAHITPFKNS